MHSPIRRSCFDFENFRAWAERIRGGSMVVTGPLKGAQVVLETGGRNEGPAYSPDGKRMVFMSNRGGGMDLWVSEANGTNPRQITTLGTTGTPRWSPNGKLIAFDARINDTGAILVTSAGGGQPQILVIGKGNNAVPSWSHDGKHIYYASERSGRYEVWRVGTDGSENLQITGQGGFAPLESPDGKTLYYSKTQFDRPEIWSVPAQGGEEKLVSREIRPGTWASWMLTANGIYFVEEGPGNVAALSYFDLRTQQLRQLTLLGRFPFWLAVSPDEKTALVRPRRLGDENEFGAVAGVSLSEARTPKSFRGQAPSRERNDHSRGHQPLSSVPTCPS